MTTTAAQPTTTTRFRYIADNDVIYVGEAEILTEDITILSCFRIGMTIEEVYPYDTKFNYALRNRLELAALECAMTPPATPVELPSDWDEIEILDTETVVTVKAACILPEINSDIQAAAYGLSTVRRIKHTGKDQYRIETKGPLANVQRELYKARLF